MVTLLGGVSRWLGIVFESMEACRLETLQAVSVKGLELG